MAKIGILNKQDNDNFEGAIKTLQLSSKLTLTVNDNKQSENAPDFIACAGDIEIGAGWNKTSEKGNEFISLSIDDPSLANPIYASVFANKDNGFDIIWNRKSD